jgi:hypothetical protein
MYIILLDHGLVNSKQMQTATQGDDQRETLDKKALCGSHIHLFTCVLVSLALCVNEF